MRTSDRDAPGTGGRQGTCGGVPGVDGRGGAKDVAEGLCPVVADLVRQLDLCQDEIGHGTEKVVAIGDVAGETVQNALFHAEAALFFGLPFLLIGLATRLPAAGLPRNTGWLALIGGAGALVFGASGLTGADLPGLLFNGFAGLITGGRWSPGSSCGGVRRHGRVKQLSRTRL